MRRYKAAAIIIIIHGLIEISGFFAVLPIWFGAEPSPLIPFDPPSLEVLIGGVIWAALRIISGIGLLKGYKWAFVLALINCVLAISAMFEIMPFGLMDATLGGAALILMLTQYFGKQKLVEDKVQ